MNAAFLIMSSAALAGADPAPVAAPAMPAAPVVISGTGCSNCGTVAYTADCGGCKPSLLDRLKAKFSGFGKKSHDCGCAPAPAPCTTCHSHPGNFTRPNLFDTLKSRCGSKKCGPTCDPCGATTVSGCASPLPAGAAPVTPPMTGTTTPPKEMPKDPTPPKEMPKKGGNTSSVPPVSPTPVTGAALTSPY